MGYVGLTTAIAFAKKGFKTICTDIIPKKAENLNKGIPPFFESDLEKLLKETVGKGMLTGSHDNVSSIKDSNVTFICVGTPSLSDGSTDLTAIGKVSKDIGIALQNHYDYHLTVVKSTLPPGTSENLILSNIEKYSDKKAGADFGLCVNPEFLRQGNALYDSFNPDRIVIGQFDKKSGDLLESFYKDYTCPKIRCDIKTAELIKYASNSLLATKISFANEFSRICEKLNVDVYEVMKGVGLDSRINPRFLRAGCGFGGSCFPKDVKSIVSLSKKLGVETPILNSVLYTNEIQAKHLVNLVLSSLGSLEGKVISFLGLSFKPNTDDVRETRALPIIEKLIEGGAHIKAYDPQAIENFKNLTDLPIEYFEDWRDALKDADLSVIQSDWKEVKGIKPEDYKSLMKNPIIVDGRRTYDPLQMVCNGIQYFGVGWRNLGFYKNFCGADEN
jgi:UDPglucose 6-dehydrogenase